MVAMHAPLSPGTSTPLDPATIPVSVLSYGITSSALQISTASPLGKMVKKIRSSDSLAERTDRLREALAATGRKGPYETLKNKMPAIIPASQAGAGVSVEKLPTEYHNGLYAYDLDEDRGTLDLPALRSALIDTPGAVMVSTSCAGDALYALFAGPKATSSEDYTAKWKAIESTLPDAARAASGKASKNFNRLRFICHDPLAWLAESVSPLSFASPAPATPTLTGAGLFDTLEGDRQALTAFSPPTDYNSWLSWITTLKALGFTASEVEAWSATGENYQVGEVESRWAGLNDDRAEDARNKLRGHAYNLGWRKASGEIPPAAPSRIPAAPSQAPATDSAGNGRISDFHQLAEWIASSRLGGRYLYDSTPGELAWWYYDGKVWRPLSNSDPRLMDEVGRERYNYASGLASAGAEGLADTLIKQWMSKAGVADLAAGLRHSMKGAAPEPEHYHLGTPDGVVDLRDGQIYPHAPHFQIRGVTKGRYLPQVSPAKHWEAINRRFGPVFSRETQLEYIRLVALALTGRAQSYRAIVLVTGPSGSGKGDACNAVLNALSDRGAGVSADYIGTDQRSDIDAITTDILERQPAILKVDEVGGDTRVGVSRLLALTGNAERQSRKPHGPIIRGTPRFQLWTTAVDAPEFPAHSGIRRRLAVLATTRELNDSEINEDGVSDQALLDAIVTLAVIAAREVYLPGYVAPEGDKEAKRKTIVDMDVVAAWLEEQDDLDGISKAEARKRCLEQLEISERDLTATAFGTRVNASLRWQPHREGVARKIQRRPGDGERLV